ncbi:MAG TPA: sulfotransferase [Pararobbsia sp.]|nr:sulfotransferase [Pararobbsia sp.]
MNPSVQRYWTTVQHLRKAVAQSPDDAVAWHNLGWALHHLQDLEDALACYRQAVRANPRSHNSWNHIGWCLNTLGRNNDALAAWGEAIRLAPDQAVYYRSLTQAGEIKADDPSFALLRQQVDQITSRSKDEQIDLHFALGKALSDQGQHTEGFHHIINANQLYRSTLEYDESLTLDLLNESPAIYTQDLLQAKRGLGSGASSPVFVVGMPRSGSTLVEQILSSHAQVFGAGEAYAFRETLAQGFSRGPSNGAGPLDIEHLAALTTAQLEGFGADYLRRIADDVPHANRYARIVDKNLYNFMHLGLIHLALPNARFIHTTRSPVQTCLSIYARHFRNVPFSYDLGELGRYYRAYDTLMAHWHRVLPAGALLDVQYEDLVDDLEGNVRTLLAHCGLDWDQRCLDFHATERKVGTSSAAQVRRPLYRSSLKKWRPGDALLKPLYDALGPELCAASGDGTR